MIAEIKYRNPRRYEQRFAKLLDRWRSFLGCDTRKQRYAFYGRPVEPKAISRKPRKIIKLAVASVEIDRKITKRRRDAARFVCEWNIYARADIGLITAKARAPRNTTAHRLAHERARIKATAQRRLHPTRRQFKQRARQCVDRIARCCGRRSTITPAALPVSQCLEPGAINIAGERPLPAANRPIKRQPAVERTCGRVAVKRINHAARAERGNTKL